jgi:septin family protein
LLQKLLLYQHTQHMIDLTSSTHYETYRCNKLTRLVGGEPGTDISGKNLLTFLANESADHVHGVENMKNQMECVFNKKVEEKQRNFALLEIQQNEDVEKESKAINLERSTLLSKRAEFEKEKTEWEQRSKSSFNRGSKSMESLGRRNKLNFSLGSVNSEGKCFCYI